MQYCNLYPANPVSRKETTHHRRDNMKVKELVIGELYKPSKKAHVIQLPHGVPPSIVIQPVTEGSWIAKGIKEHWMGDGPPPLFVFIGRERKEPANRKGWDYWFLLNDTPMVILTRSIRLLEVLEDANIGAD
jgi:hypothetical protein